MSTGPTVLEVDSHPPDIPTDKPKPTLLVVEDDSALAELLDTAFGLCGYRVITATSGVDALSSVSLNHPDLLILDVNLPDLNGFEVCRQLRAGNSRVPVIFLTARDRHDDLRAGFEVGGDDYISKPFSLDELRLRVAAVLRRTPVLADLDAADLSCGDLVMRPSEYQVWRGDKRLDLSPTEFRLLHYLLVNKGTVLSRSQILSQVWEYDFGGRSQIVSTYICYLRRKMDDSDQFPMLRTVRGVGYLMQDPSQ